MPDPVITPPLPADLDALTALFGRSSEATRRERFHGSLRRLPCQYLRDVACGATGVIGRVARDLASDPSGGCVVGVATSMVESSGRAELAVWVDDAWQRRGVGTRLVRSVVDQLRTDGVHQVVAYVEPSNVGAIALARRLAHWLDVSVPTGPELIYDLTAHSQEAIA
jgi:RimJ/RimL family protein N-acetyltransferase